MTGINPAAVLAARAGAKRVERFWRFIGVALGLCLLFVGWRWALGIFAFFQLLAYGTRWRSVQLVRAATGLDAEQQALCIRAYIDAQRRRN